MKSVDLFIADRSMYLRGRLDTEWAGVLIASLSADPMTWDELRHAIRRFVPSENPSLERALMQVQGFPAAGADETGRGSSADSLPDCLIDLPGRILLTRWDQSLDPIPVGILRGKGSGFGPLSCEPPDCEPVDCEPADCEPADYDLSADWLISTDFRNVAQRVEQRRREQALRWSVDSRITLYGTPLLTFLVEQCGARIASLGRTAKATTEGPPASDGIDAELWRVARKLFWDWLEQQPAALGGRTVRAVVLHDQDHLARDLEDRESQWARMGTSPIGLRETDTAYRCAGFGPHEAILYEELTMYLIGACMRRREDESTDPVNDLPRHVDWLRERRDEWLWRADEEGLMGKSPREIIDLERRRMPLVIEEAHDVLHDDCPLCQMMMTEDGHPVFWRLNSWDSVLVQGGDLDLDYDDDAADEEQFDGVTREDREQAHKQELLPVDHDGSDRLGFSTASADESRRFPPMDSVWRRVCIVSDPGQVSPEVDLFTVAACTAELIEDLKEREAVRTRIDALNRHVGNLTSALRARGGDLLEPVVARFCECLDDIEACYEELADKVDDLQSRLVGLLPPETD